MSAAEIIAELPRLSAEERALIRLRLEELAPSESSTAQATHTRTTAHVRSPRLADPSRLADFAKTVREIDDAGL